MSCSFPCVNFYHRWRPPTFLPHARQHTDHELGVLLINHQHVIALNRQPPFCFWYFFGTRAHTHTHAHSIFKYFTTKLSACWLCRQFRRRLFVAFPLFSFCFLISSEEKKNKHTTVILRRISSEEKTSLLTSTCPNTNEWLNIFIWRTTERVQHQYFSNA